MERDSSSDEEDDRQNLIPQNDEVKHLPSPTRSPFQIDDFHSSIRRRFHSHFNKRYLLAIILPLLILILYFSTDIRKLFPSNLKFDRMRESELRALYLLRQQQLGLLSLWNNSQLGTENRSFVPSTALVDDLKSAVLRQISLNKEIQLVLLSSHRYGNLSEFQSDFRDPSFGGSYGFDRCRKVDQKMNERRTIEWKPKSNKYLFAICLSGQMSNHLICLEKHMFFAALLNRVLVVPSSKVDYQYSRVLDIDHINNCLGRKVVVSFEEFSEAKKNHMHVDRTICYFSLPQPCYLDEEHIKKLKSLGISMRKPEPVWVEDIRKPNKRTAQDVQSKFASDDDVIAIGDVFYADVEQYWVMQPGGPLAHKCKTLIEPSRLIMLTAQRFIQTFLGKNFIALHFRRHGFLKFWYVIIFSSPFLILLSKWRYASATLCFTSWVVRNFHIAVKMLQYQKKIPFPRLFFACSVCQEILGDERLGGKAAEHSGNICYYFA